jgi:outer membrane immunogenic protein
MKRIWMTITVVCALAIVGKPSVAADIPVKAQSYRTPVSAPLFDWAGFYVGAQGGYGWGKSQHDDLGTLSERFSLDGWFGGATVGYNWQFASPWVLGAEADFSWSDVKGAVRGLSGMFGCSNSIGCLTDVKWFGTARLRAGVVHGQSLFYVTGGIAHGKIYAYSNTPDFGTAKRTTWTAGAGWEHAFAPHWSAKIEYLYFDFGKFTYDNNPPPDNYRATTHVHLVRAGLNYRFATGEIPIKAKY